MNPGRYDRLCEVQVSTANRGSAGGVQLQWSTSFSFWAEKSEQGSRRFQAAAVDNVEITAVFTTPWHPDLKARQRFTCEGQTYEIVGAPREIGRRDELLITARTLPA